MSEAIQVFDGIDAAIVGNNASETSYDPAPLSELIRTRSYSRRKPDNSLEDWDEATDRCLYSEHSGLSFLGKFTDEEIELVDRMQRSRKAFGSARWLWVGGTPWISKPESYPGAFNCSAWEIADWGSFGIMMDLAMMGCGTGANVELRCIEQLPDITTKLNVTICGKPGDGDPGARNEETLYGYDDDEVWIVVGDSRQGWVKAYQSLLELASSGKDWLHVYVDLTGVRGAGELLKGFGGISNPIALSKMFERVAKVTNQAIGRKLNSLEVCQVIGEAAGAVVAGSIRRSAGMRVGSSDDEVFTVSKDNLWQQDKEGGWKIDPNRDSLRSANHTRAFHKKPTLEQCVEAVTKQFYSGEGAIQWSGEAVARANADLLDNPLRKEAFLKLYDKAGVDTAKDYLGSLGKMDERELENRIRRYSTNPCLSGETLVLTRSGAFQVKDLVGKTVVIWDGIGWTEVDSFRVTGRNQKVYALEYIVESDIAVGSTMTVANTLRATACHEFYSPTHGKKVQLKDLEAGDELLHVQHGVKTVIVVVRIKEDGIEPEVYCCTVPTTNQFALASGLMVGNCHEIIGTDFMCVGEETLLITKCGLHRIKDIVGQKVEIWNGQRWSEVEPFLTGRDRQLFRVEFSDGTFLDVTEYHRFFVKDRFGRSYKEVQTKDLMSFSRYQIHSEPFTIQYTKGLDIDTAYAYTLGAAVGDGTIGSKGKPILRLYTEKQTLVLAGKKSPPRNYDYCPPFSDVTDMGFSGHLQTELKTNPKALDAMATWSRKSILYFIAGMADTDGSDTAGNGIRIYISDRDRAHRVQLLLVKCGIQSSLNFCSPKGFVTNKGVRSRDLYYLQITDCREIPCQRLDVSKGRKPKCKGKWQIIRSVKALSGIHDTYCFSEKDLNKGVFGNTLTGNCNLSEVHLNAIDPFDLKEQHDAFRASSLQASALLQRGFHTDRLEYARSIDPIVGVSATGFFVFFTRLFGSDYVRWWASDRAALWDGIDTGSSDRIDEVKKLIYKTDEGACLPGRTLGQLYKEVEAWFLELWKNMVFTTVWEYCDRHNLRRPNRCTTVKPSGSMSLLTGVDCNGLHPPFAPYFIRRMTFSKDDPVALAAIDYGYNVVPSQNDKDEDGNLLNDPFSDRCTEWLVEVPVKNQITHYFPEVADVDFRKFSALAQFDFYMNVQTNYITHTGSVTISLGQDEIEPLAQRIYDAIQADEGYIGAALLARYDSPYPRLPFEVMSEEQYNVLIKEVQERRKSDDFNALINKHLQGVVEAGPQDSACDSGACELRISAPQQAN